MDDELPVCAWPASLQPPVTRSVYRGAAGCSHLRTRLPPPAFLLTPSLCLFSGRPVMAVGTLPSD